MLWGGGEDIASIVAECEPMERPMQKLNDLSRSLTALEPDITLIAVIEMSLSSWLVGGIVPGLERQPLKKLAADESALLKLLHRWREEAEQAGRRIARVVIAFEAGRDGFWLARWLRARGIEAHVFTPRVWRCLASIVGRSPIVSTPSCLNARFSAGCVASVITARWSRSP
jgi:hypothetical protein